MFQIFKAPLVCFFTVFIAFWITSPVHAEDDTFNCKECHTGEVMTKKHPFEIVDSCITCHNMTKEHAIKHANFKKQTDDSSFTISDKMAYPQYYDKSRLGDKPNKMVEIPAGKFIMGSNSRMPDEGPKHSVYLKKFYIDIYEVTNLQYKAFIDATGRRSPKHFRNRTYPKGKADHPVTFVSWKDATAYCKWAGKRLPTDAEWEKAGRGPKDLVFPWGNSFEVERANTPQRWQVLGKGKDGDTTPVGSFPAGKSAYGLYDMSGNVWEWTSSWYLPYPGNNHPTENYGKKYKTLKGGSWWDCSFYQCGISAPLFNRGFFLKSTKNSSFGFRCASDKVPTGVQLVTASYNEKKGEK